MQEYWLNRFGNEGFTNLRYQLIQMKFHIDCSPAHFVFRLLPKNVRPPLWHYGRPAGHFLNGRPSAKVAYSGQVQYGFISWPVNTEFPSFAGLGLVPRLHETLLIERRSFYIFNFSEAALSDHRIL